MKKETNLFPLRIKNVKDILNSNLGLGEIKKILDFGCGFCPYHSLFSENSL